MDPAGTAKLIRIGIAEGAAKTEALAQRLDSESLVHSLSHDQVWKDQVYRNSSKSVANAELEVYNSQMVLRVGQCSEMSASSTN